MRTRRISLALLGLLAAAAPQDEPQWWDDFRAAQAEALKTGQPMFVIFR